MKERLPPVLLPPGRLTTTLTRFVPDAAARSIAGALRQASFLVTTLRKVQPA